MPPKPYARRELPLGAHGVNFLIEIKPLPFSGRRAEGSRA